MNDKYIRNGLDLLRKIYEMSITSIFKYELSVGKS